MWTAGPPVFIRAMTRQMRSEILLSAARHFRPDALIVDHAPAGLKGEVVPMLRYLKNNRPSTQLVAGLRDVVDGALQVRQMWLQERVYELLDDVYDLILVYGCRDVNDVAAEYGLSRRAARKVRYLGYLRRESGARPPDQVRAELGMVTDRLVVVTAGGGGDGYRLFRAMLDAIGTGPEPAGFDCLLVGGPLMSADDRDSLAERMGADRSVHFLDFTTDMTGYIGAADAVVSMGGYNSVCEILSLGRPAIIVPRVAPRQEQLVRAEVLSRRGLVRMIHPDELSPRRLLSAVSDLLERPPSRSAALDMDGLPRFAVELGALLSRRPGRRRSAGGTVT
jgi:predicted glycosyltransferase